VVHCPGKENDATAGSRESRQNRSLLVPASGDDVGLSRKKDIIGEDGGQKALNSGILHRPLCHPPAS
jgi:hypothetical protein